MSFVLHKPTESTGSRGSAVLVKEVAARTEAVDVGKVRENLELRGEPKPPGNEGRCVHQAVDRHHPVRRARAERRIRPLGQHPGVFSMGEGEPLHLDHQGATLRLRGRRQARLEVHALLDDGRDQSVGSHDVGEQGRELVAERSPNGPGVHQNEVRRPSPTADLVRDL